MGGRTPRGRERSSRPSTLRRVLRALATGAAWFVAAGLLASSTVWMWSGSSYWGDLLANLGAQLLLVALAGALGVLALRRWRAMAVAMLACGLLALPLVRHRAAFLARPIDNARPLAPDEVRFLHYNDASESAKAEVYELIDRVEADIVEILSPPVGMQFDVIYGDGMSDRYPGKLTRLWQADADGRGSRTSPGFVLSRWPIEPYDLAFLGPLAERFMAGVVRRPGGAFAVVAVHPRSPRNAARWREGNDVVERLVDLAVRLRSEGLPVVVLTDLNSTPTGWRSRTACSGADLRRAKPLLVPDGTYPDVVPINIRTNQKSRVAARWPASIAIDDALVSEGIQVSGWRVDPRGALKSEHRPVTIQLRIPPPPSGRTNTPGR